MHGDLTHFAINADDLAATRGFYEALFGWRFTEAYPGFWRTTDAGPAIGAVQSRRTFARDAGLEVTFAVDDVAAAAGRAERHGGTVLMPPSVIPDVGELLFLADPSGNVTGAMRYFDRA
jgi:predicted enzyme related to lactoylglutathione lyase